ncbi:MAG: class I SAM-dependent methyltransferase [Armatimonadota bacterium]
MSLYEQLGGQYDEMISWDARYAREAGFFRRLFDREGVVKVLDAACGTGMHARWFAEWGLQVVAADPSPAMLAAAQRNTRGLPVSLVQSAFGSLHRMAGTDFDAVVCLGNSLPHAVTDDELRQAIGDFRRTLRTGGVLIVHNNNYDRILAGRERFMPLAHRHTPDGQKLFLRFFDFPDGPGILQFNVVILAEQGGQWSMNVSTALHRPLLRADMQAALEAGGFAEISFYGAFTGEAFVEDESDNLIAVARAV